MRTPKDKPMTEEQRAQYLAMSAEERNLVDKGYATMVISLDDQSTICDFNMPEDGKIPITKAQAESLARAFLPSIQKFYEDPKNCADFEKWKKEKEGAMTELHNTDNPIISEDCTKELGKIGNVRAVAALLRERRKELGLTQSEVAEQSDLQLRAYNRFEHGERDILKSRTDIFLKVCVALKLNRYDVLNVWKGE